MNTGSLVRYARQSADLRERNQSRSPDVIVIGRVRGLTVRRVVLGKVLLRQLAQAVLVAEGLEGVSFLFRAGILLRLGRLDVASD